MLRNICNIKHLLKMRPSILIYKYFKHKFSTNYEYTVSPFCKIYIESPFSLKIQPLDVQSLENDKIVIKFNKHGLKTNPTFDCVNNNDQIQLIGNCESDLTNNSVLCVIEAPIKSDLQVNMLGNANVDLKYFCGDIIQVQTDNGNIDMYGALCETITLISTSGDITCHSTVQAKDIDIKTSTDGNIRTKKLQGINLNVCTENGIIQTDSSYCTNTTFSTSSGELDLSNVHMNCEVLGDDIKKIQMTGIDGVLNVDINKCKDTMYFQISQLLNESNINIKDEGDINLKITENVQEKCDLEINAKCVQCDIKEMYREDTNNLVKLKSDESTEEKIKLFINSQKSNVTVAASSWQEMFRL